MRRRKILSNSRQCSSGLNCWILGFGLFVCFLITANILFLPDVSLPVNTKNPTHFFFFSPKNHCGRIALVEPMFESELFFYYFPQHTNTLPPPHTIIILAGWIRSTCKGWRVGVGVSILNFCQFITFTFTGNSKEVKILKTSA